MTPAQREAILAEVKGGNKIAAIKLCREATGMGLAEAKDFVERLETSPDAQLAPAPETGALSGVAGLLFAGRKIDAIKLYREQVKPGAGLKESKEAVEQLEAGLRAQHPEKFTAKAKSGCATVLAVLAMLLVVLVWFRF
jgi:ribosomal protein L7/L12